MALTLTQAILNIVGDYPQGITGVEVTTILFRLSMKQDDTDYYGISFSHNSVRVLLHRLRDRQMLVVRKLKTKTGVQNKWYLGVVST